MPGSRGASRIPAEGTTEEPMTIADCVAIVNLALIVTGRRSLIPRMWFGRYVRPCPYTRCDLLLRSSYLRGGMLRLSVFPENSIVIY